MAIDRSVNAPCVCPDLITKTVYFMGSDEVKEGEPFVYTVANGTAAEYDGLRHNQVERPKASGGVFAGVATRTYPAADPGNGRLIEIAMPGSRGVRIRLGAAGNTGAVVQFAFKASVGGKTFKAAGTPHTLAQLVIGDAVLRQTVSAAGLCQADLADGPLATGVSE